MAYQSVRRQCGLNNSGLGLVKTGEYGGPLFKYWPPYLDHCLFLFFLFFLTLLIIKYKNVATVCEGDLD